MPVETSVERAIINEATGNLKKLGYLNDIEIIESRTDLYDFEVMIDGNKFICEVKNSVTISNFGLISSRLHQVAQKINQPVLLVAKQISPNLTHIAARL